MPELRKRELIEERLLAEMQAARRRYRAKEGDPNDYPEALKRFNDFVIHGKLPEDLTSLKEM